MTGESTVSVEEATPFAFTVTVLVMWCSACGRLLQFIQSLMSGWTQRLLVEGHFLKPYPSLLDYLKERPRNHFYSWHILITCRLFADDCLQHSTITTEANSRQIQNDLDNLQGWVSLVGTPQSKKVRQRQDDKKYFISIILCKNVIAFLIWKIRLKWYKNRFLIIYFPCFMPTKLPIIVVSLWSMRYLA